MSWLPALPVAAVAVAWILLPGLLAALALGLRGIVAVGVAPVLSVASIAVGAIVAGLAGIPWSPLVAPVAALALGLLAAIVRLLRRGRRATRPDGWAPLLSGAAGLVAAAALGAITGILAMRRPAALNQTYDAVFHYNAVADIVDSRNASSLVVGTLTDPAATHAFYPAAWHDLVSLVLLSGVGSVPVASNVVALVVASVVWPSTCLVLVRQVLGRSVAAALLTPVVAVGFMALPWTLLSFGVLWPNLLGLTLVPVALAAVVTVCGVARDSAMTGAQAAVVGAVALVALGLAHPNTVFSLAALAVAPVLWWATARLRLLAGSGRRGRAAGLAAAAALVGAAALYLIIASPLFAQVRAFDWAAFQTPPQAVGETLLNATNGKDAAWALSLVVVLGMVSALRDRPTRWLPVAHAVSALLFLLSSSLETPIAQALTGLWYNDSHRLAAMLPITGVPLAVLGLVAAGGWIAARVRGGSHGVAPTVATGALLVLLTSGMYVRDHAEVVSAAYPRAEIATLLPPPQRAFLERVGSLVPPDAVVAQNPWNGSALLWALTGRDVLFPHLAGAWTDDQRYLAQHLRRAAADPKVCRIADDLGVDFVLTGEARFWPWDGRKDQYPGLERLTGVPGFESVASGGGYRLYRLAACDDRDRPTTAGRPARAAPPGDG